MKYVLALILILLAHFASAHSGGLDKNSCHSGSQNYHCHKKINKSALPKPGDILEGRVTRVRDGDTIEVKSSVDCQGTMLSKVNLLSEIKVYPNPITNSFTISSNGTDWETLNIYNTLGVKVYGNKNNGNQSLIVNSKEHSMASGLYFIVFNGKKGNVYRQKLIVK